MKPARFRYHSVKSVEEAVAVLSDVAPEDGRVLAGGQSLVPMMAFRLAQPGHLVDINAIAELHTLTREPSALLIGAGVRHAAFHYRVAPGPLGALLSEVVQNIAHYPIRIRGTFCGSVAHADPASEWCLVAVTLDAEMLARSRHDTRIIAARDFFRGMMMTALTPDELLTAVRMPLLPEDSRYGFYEFSRRAGDYALAAALAVYRIRHGIIAESRVGLCGAEACPRRIPQAEAMLNGQPPGPDAFTAAARAAAAAVDAMEDAQVSADFRRKLVTTVTERALKRSAQGFDS